MKIIINRAFILALVLSLLSLNVFAKSNKPVTLQADIITYDSTTGVSTAEGNVVITQEDGTAKGMSAEYNIKTKSGWIAGSVTGTKGEASLAAQKVWISNQNYVRAEGDARISKAGDSVYAPTIEYWSDREFAKTSGGWGKLSQKDGSTLTAQYIEYNMKNGFGTAQNNVKIAAPARNLTGAGNKATYTAGKNGNPGEFVLTGNAWVVQDGNKIIGNSLVIKSDSSSSNAQGNVRMDIIPKEQTDKTEKLKDDNNIKEEVKE